MSEIKKLAYLSLTLLLGCFTAQAKEPQEVQGKKEAPAWTETKQLDKQQALIAKVSEGQVKVLQSFKVSEELQGFVVKTATDKEAILYVNQEADLLFMGTLVSQDGTDLTSEYTQKYIHAAIAKQAYEELNQTTWFQEGQDSAPHKLYVLVDPMCGFCKKQYALLKPLIAKGEVQVRWVLVGYLRPESAGIAVNILMGQNDQEKIERLAKHEQTGVKPVSPDSNVFLTTNFFATVSKNTAFFEKFSSYFIGTPTFLYLNDAHQPQFHPGMIVEERMKSVLLHVGKDWSL